MSTEMSSVKSAPSSAAPSCFDRYISFSPTLTDKRGIDEGVYRSLSAAVTHLFLFADIAVNKRAASADAPSCGNQAEPQSVSAQGTYLSRQFSVSHKPSESYTVWTESEDYRMLAALFPHAVRPVGAGETRRRRSGEWELWNWSKGLSRGPCLRGRRADRRMWWVTGTCARSTRWPGEGQCQWGKRTYVTPCICSLCQGSGTAWLFGRLSLNSSL